MITCSVKPADISKKWIEIDASGQVLGRLASEAARLLRGKHKVNFVPHLDCGDYVIIKNADKIQLTGRKWDQKVYHHHSTFIGGLKSIKAKDLVIENPEKLVRTAIKGMLPKNKLAREVIKNLKVYRGAEHKHQGQKPVALAPRLGKGE